MNILRKSILSFTLVGLISGCGSGDGETYNQSSDTLPKKNTIETKIESVEVEHSVNYRNNRSISLKMSAHSDSDISNIPINYYLVAYNENSDTSESLEYYNIGSDIINFKDGQVFSELNTTLGSKIPAGRYHIATHIDPLETQDLLYSDNMKFSITDTTIEIESGVLDVELLSAKVDDDVLVLNLDNLDHILMATLKIKSNFNTIKNIGIKVSVIVDEKVIELPIYDKDGELSYLYNMEQITENTKNIGLVFGIPNDLQKKWISGLKDGINNGEIRFTLVSNLEDEDKENNVKEIPFSIYNDVKPKRFKRWKIDFDKLKETGKELAEKVVEEVNELVEKKKEIEEKDLAEYYKANGIIKLYSKSIELNKESDLFQAKISSYPQAMFGYKYSYASCDSSIDIKILKKRFNFSSFNIMANVQYDSFKDTYYSVNMKVLGINAINKKADMATLIGTYHTVKEIDKIQDLSDDEKEEVSKEQIIVNKSMENQLLGYSKNFFHDTYKKKSKVITVGIVPVIVKVKAGGVVGIKTHIGLDGILSLSTGIEPYGQIDGSTSVGVGVDGFSAGVEGNMIFISNKTPATTKFQFQFTVDDNEDLKLQGILSEKIVNTLQGPNGDVNLYAEGQSTKFCKKKKIGIKVIYPCGFKTVKGTKNIFNWDSGLIKEKTLLDKNQTLVDIKLN